MGNLIPGETLIYERVNRTVYARYANKPEIPRWVIGTALEQPTYDKLESLAEHNPTFKAELDKLLNLYYLLK